MEIIHLEKEDFNSLIKDKVLVDFYANWCGPCKMLGPVLEKVESDIKVIKVDVDAFEDLAREYGVAKNSISNINTGITAYNPKLEYPLNKYVRDEIMKRFQFK